MMGGTARIGESGRAEITDRCGQGRYEGHGAEKERETTGRGEQCGRRGG